MVNADSDRISNRLHLLENAALNLAAIQIPDSFQAQAKLFEKRLEILARSHSTSWFGDHSTTYFEDFNSPPAGSSFNVEWGFEPGFSRIRNKGWKIYSREQIMSFVFDGIGEETYHAIADTLKALERGYNQLRDQSLDLLQLLGKADASGSIPRYHETIANDLRVYKVSDYVNARLNSTPQMTRDSEEYAKGRMVPVHVQYAALLEIIAKNKARAEAIGTILRNLTELLIMNSLIAPPSSGGMRIFIGHGRSLQWRVLKDFLRDSLGLEHDEFNRISPAGLSNQQRLDDMMKECGFAFLVMTAEDESADGQLHARENVIHEAGLFQGSKGWKKAIIVLEEGCKEFSNINGLGQIRFPKGRINNCFEEIRQVLQREKII